MTHDFASVVDPIILTVLDLLKRIGGGKSIDYEHEHQRLRDLINRADAQMGDNEEWELAKYALVAWTDDVLIETPWEGAQWWYDNPLEVKFFRTRQAYSRFYTMAREAESLPQKNALEVFYVCVVLGFRGLYKNPTPGAEAEDLRLPGDLQTWSKQVVRSIRLGQGLRTPSGHPETRMGAPPLEGKFRLLGSILLMAIMAGITFVLLYSLISSGE
jgi:type VI secretion system protein ImpK